MKKKTKFWLSAVGLSLASLLPQQAAAQAMPACPEKNVMYWQAFPPGGESDLSARHQQMVLKKRCSAIDTINVVGINLPHIVFQPIEGEVQYKTADITPVFWFHYTPDVLVVPESSPIKSFAEFIAAAKQSPGKMNLGGSGLNSANHAAHERLNAAFGIKSTYVPYKGTGDMSLAVVGAQIDGAVTYTPFAIANRGKVRALAVAMEKRHPLMPNVPTFRELGVDWIDGAYRGVGVPRSTSPEARKRLSDMWLALNNDPEMKELAAKSGFELVNIGTDQMDAFMKERIALYIEGAKRLGLGKK
jgi:tripartite-type tricarboxylate transporter receptor subunit TctC